MDFESSDDRLPTNPSNRSSGEGIPKERREQILGMLKDGVAIREIERQTETDRHTIRAIRAKEEDTGGFTLGSWKKTTASTMAAIVSKGSERLLNEIDNIPAGQLPLALAIMTDKVLALQDAPAVVVEHRLRVTHEDINKMIRGERDIIDLNATPKDSVDKV